MQRMQRAVRKQSTIIPALPVASAIIPAIIRGYRGRCCAPVVPLRPMFRHCSQREGRATRSCNDESVGRDRESLCRRLGEDCHRRGADQLRCEKECACNCGSYRLLSRCGVSLLDCSPPPRRHEERSPARCDDGQQPSGRPRRFGP